MNSNIKIPDYYICKGKDNKEQIVKYYQINYNNNKNEIFYRGYYGVFGYHEVSSRLEDIRKLTTEEREYLSKKKFWKLPQQFYQSTPEF